MSVWSVIREILLFLAAGICEIGGGWLVWQTMRNSKPWYWAFCGSLVLILYGFIPTFQQLDNFGRLYSVYGGYFIMLSLFWGWGLDRKKPDIGDWIGSSIAIVGVCVMLYWPRAAEAVSNDEA
jgi:small multidrug resistance family-3 protein